MADPQRLDVSELDGLERVDKLCWKCGEVFEGYRFANIPRRPITLPDGKVVEKGMCTPCAVTWDTEVALKDFRQAVLYWSQQLKIVEKRRDQIGVLTRLERALRQLRDATPDDVERERCETQRRTVEVERQKMKGTA